MDFPHIKDLFNIILDYIQPNYCYVCKTSEYKMKHFDVTKLDGIARYITCDNCCSCCNSTVKHVHHHNCSFQKKT